MNQINGQTIDEIFSASSRQVFASLVRILGDFDLAEDALQDAFAAAIEQWKINEIPENPIAWLVSAGRFKAIDRIRRTAKLNDMASELTRRLDAIRESNEVKNTHAIPDDRLRLIFTCCHPAIDRLVQVPLTLREVCGLTTDEIASAFLIDAKTMAQRLVRGKAKIRDAKIPIEIPELSELPARLNSVLSIIYLIFNEGYSASHGDSLTRGDLSNEAIRLCRLVLSLHDDDEVRGLLALMLLHESRRGSRTDANGDIVLLEDQNRGRWNQGMIREGKTLVEQSLRNGRIGTYALQAAISAIHAEAQTAAKTDWHQIIAIYDVLARISQSPVVELNRAVAIAMRDGPAAGIGIINELLDRGELDDYSLAHSARGELLSRLGDIGNAIMAFEKSLQLCSQESERRFLERKLSALKAFK